MSDLFGQTVEEAKLARVTIDDMIDCATRELNMRQRVYGRFVKGGTMTPEKAEIELLRMKAIKLKLEEIKRQDVPGR